MMMMLVDDDDDDDDEMSRKDDGDYMSLPLTFFHLISFSSFSSFFPPADDVPDARYTIRTMRHDALRVGISSRLLLMMLCSLPSFHLVSSHHE